MKQLPEKIALDKAVHGQRLYQGTIEIKHLLRLSGMLTNTKGLIDFSIQFNRARGLLGKAQVKVKTGLALICKVSQKEFMFPVEINTYVGFLDDLAYEHLLDSDMEASWVEGDYVCPQDLIEDELILAVPDVPFDESYENDEPEEDIVRVESKSNPFDVLKDLK